MNDVLVLVYLIFFVSLFGATFAFMWKMMSTTLDDFNKPIKTKLPAPHPEMAGVNYGEELLIFTPETEEDDDDGDIIVRS